MPSTNIILMGPPGSGKGTQAVRIAQRYHVPIISTGDILRATARSGSALGLELRAIMASGGLVSDGMMVDLVRERLQRSDATAGFILDGFPRTVGQAGALAEMLGGRPVVAVVLEVPDQDLEARLDSRRICLKCRAVYHSGTRLGSEAETCARCGVALIKRDDDNLEVIRTRLQTYHRDTEPVLAYYAERGALVTIDGSPAPDAVTRAIIRAIDARRQVFLPDPGAPRPHASKNVRRS
ncbi:MAG: adenylate kinase [Acidobacteria bacterium]|nr:adenylate kinase [Acidobacteriota bacterium]